MKQSTAILSLILGLITLAAVIYNAGRSQERTAAALRRLCEHVHVLEQIQYQEHPNYWPSIAVNKGCDE